jgi:amino acid adenylation domain-containing protein
MSQQIEGYRLSPQQQRIWQLHRNGFPVRSQCAIALEGNLRPDALREAVQDVVGRHEILRTVFYRSPGITMPIQMIAENGATGWQGFDWSAMSAPEQDAALEALFAQEERHASEAEHEPVLRAALVTLAPQRFLLHLSLPSLCADAWTFSNLAREIAAAYKARQENGVLSGEVMQYLQFSEWQNELFEDENAALGKAYWRKQDALSQPPLTFSFEQKAASTDAGAAGLASFALTIDAAQTAEIDAAAQKCGVSTQAFLLACWQTFLWRLTGRPGIIVGLVFSGRKYEELREGLGLFAKTVPVESRFDEAMKFSEVVAQVDESARHAGEWQEWFVWQDGDRPGVDSDAPPFLPVGFEYAEWPASFAANGISFSLERQRVHIDRFHLKLDVTRREQALRVELDYRRDLFGAADIELLGGQFRALLDGAVRGLDVPVGQLEMLSADERQRLLFDFNRTQTEYPRDKPVQSLFEEQVARVPENVAVVFNEERLTYRELNERANQLAHHLRTLGVGAESLVAVCLERSPEMVVALLGILKAGGAYVPLDFTYPPERLAFILEDASVSVLLTQERLLERLPVSGAKVVCLDADWTEIAEQSAENPDAVVEPENVAYVIYTSGSTGKPKGVAIPQRGLVNYLSWCTGQYRVSEGPGSVMHSPIGFDLTITTLFAPLLAGQRVMLVPEEQGIEGLNVALQQESRQSFIKLTPSHLEVLNQMLPRASAANSTAAIILGGEALLGEQLSFWREHAPQTRLINEYGPTETVVGCCLYEVPLDADALGAIPIGRPIANVRVYLLDAHLNPVPTHVPGELYVGGDGLARGYLNRPDLTAEKFVPDPFGTQPGARLYRTGDLARHLSDRNLEFLGRIDHQVKLRGFRIELGEIEAVLGQHPSVRETVVMLREDVPGDQKLVAYAVAKNEDAPVIEELRSHLQEQLPDYMIPSAFVMLDALPLTPNGKVDRRALPAPEGLRPKLAAAYVQPQNETEQIISAIWQEALQIEKVGIHDNFFDLGGHSLLMVRVNRRLQEAFGREISMIDLFKYPTIIALSEFLTQEQKDGAKGERGQDRAQARKDSAVQQQGMRAKRRALKGQQG